MLIIMLVQMVLGAMSSAIPRSLETIESTTTQVPDIPNTINAIARMQLERCGLEEPKWMTRRHVNNPNVTCNDGSPAGYYMRHSHGSRRWIIFLEGGWYCYDQRSCHNRWMSLRHLMSSKLWPESRTVGGILSPNPEENPFWWNAHHIFVPYCTSDSWSGTRTKPVAGSRFTFMGAAVVRQVVLDLLQQGLANASSLLITGSSAGGTGAILNLNSIKALLHDELHLRHITVSGVSDSGWFLDREPYSRDSNFLAPVDAVRRGIALWQGRVPPLCAASYPTEPWRCYFGYRIYPFLTAPLFVFQWLFDEAQMTADNVGAPVTKHQWDYIHKMGDSLRHSFTNVSAVFAPSCISHSVLTKKDWQNVKIDEVTLPHAIRCWELSLDNSHRTIKDLYEISIDSTPPMLADAPLKRKKKFKGDVFRDVLEIADTNIGRKRRRRKKHKLKDNGERPNKGKKRKALGRKNKNSRALRSPLLNPINLKNVRSTPNNNQKCHHRLIERCTWPQCNHSCPKLHNPFTGEEMDFIELLKSFGLDMGSVANALGIDIHTLNNMGHAELLNLLTQQSNR